MSLHVYALTEPPAHVPERTVGIGGAALTTVTVGGLVAIASDASGAGAVDEAVLAHAKTVDEIFAANDAVLPVRFGTGSVDDASLRAAVGPRSDELVRALALVRGNVEVGLRVARAGEPERERAASGAEYLTARLTEVQAAERTAQEIHAPLAAAARAATLNVLATPDLLLSAAYLVPRDELGAFELRVALLNTRHAGLTFVCTGPWPPYSFATVDAAS